MFVSKVKLQYQLFIKVKLQITSPNVLMVLGERLKKKL